MYDDPYLKAFTAGLEWQTLLRLRIFTFRTPEGKDVPIGVEIFWGNIAHLFEWKIEQQEEIGLFEFLKPYTRVYTDARVASSRALAYLGTLPSLEVGEKALMRKKFEEATTSEEVMASFIRFRGVEIFKQRFPLEDC